MTGVHLFVRKGNNLSFSTRHDSLTVIRDSQEACRHRQRGLPPTTALRILEHSTHLPGQCYIIYTPRHCGLAGNEAAHDAAREAIHRAIAPDPTPPTLDTRPLLPYNDIITHYKLSLATPFLYPTPL